MLRQENHQRGTIAPLLSMLGLSVFARDAGLEALTYVLTGNIVMALMFGIMNNVQSHIIFMRFMGSLDYFGTLPLRKSALILAIILVFFLLALPSVWVTAVVGSWLVAAAGHPHLHAAPFRRRCLHWRHGPDTSGIRND